MNFRLAEIGIILIACSILPLFVPYGSWLFFLAMGQGIAHSFLCIMTIAGLTLLLSDKKSFLHRTKGNKIVSTLLIIIGLITFVWSLLMISMSLAVWRHDYPIEGPRYPTPEESVSYMLSLAWAGLALISGVVWFIYGFKLLDYEAYFKPLEKFDSKKACEEYPNDLFRKYMERYPHNPSGVLEWHIHEKMKEGKTREQAIKELQNIGNRLV